MRRPPGEQYSSLLAMAVGACSRGLRMIAYEEERRSRDDVLVALNAMRELCMERGIEIPANLVLRVYEEQTGESATSSLSTLVARASERKAIRGNTNAFNVIDGTLDYIENERKAVG